MSAEKENNIPSQPDLSVESRVSHAADETLVTVLGVVYAYRKTSDGGDMYLTRFGLPVVEFLELENWYESAWFTSKRQRLEGTSAVYRVPTKPVKEKQLDLVVKNCRVGEDVPLETRTLEDFINAEFNSPWEEFSLVMELREGKYGPENLNIATQVPLAIYVPPETMQLWQSGRSKDKINRIRARHPGIDLDILKQYKLIYQWIRGKDVVEALRDAGTGDDELVRVITPLTKKVIADLDKKGFAVADMKPVHIVIDEDHEQALDNTPAAPPEKQRQQVEHITRLVEQGAYSVVDYELLVRTPLHEEEVTALRRHTYLDDQRDRFKPTQLPGHLRFLEVLGVPYVHGYAESTGGHLWVVGRNARLFDYFLPERWRKTHSWKLSENNEVFYTFTKDHIHIVWKTSRVGEAPVPGPGGAQAEKMAAYGFNSPFEEVAIAQYLGDHGIPTVYVRAVYMTGSTKVEQSVDMRKYESHRGLVDERKKPILRDNRNYITIRGYYNGPDSWVAGAHELTKPMSLRQAAFSGIITAEEMQDLYHAVVAQLRNVQYDGTLLDATDMILSITAAGEMVKGADNRPEVRICNFELLHKL